MSKTFKCPICGCIEHYQIGTVACRTEELTGTGYSDNSHTKVITEPRALVKYNFSVGPDTNCNLSISPNFEAYLCKECGHIELFAEETLSKIKDSEEPLKEQIKEKASIARKTNNELENLSLEKDKVEKRLEELIQLLNSEDITIKQKREFTEEKDNLDKTLKRLNASRETLSKKAELELKELSDLVERFMFIGSIESIEKKPSYN